MDYYGSPYTHRRKTGFSYGKLVFGFAVLFVIALVVAGVGKLFSRDNKANKNILSAQTQEQKVGAKSLTQLESEIKEIFTKQKGSWSVYFKDFTSSDMVGINEQVMYTAASVNKIYVLAGLYYLAGQGEIDLDDTITLQRKDIQDFGTGTMRYDAPGTVYSLKTVARLLVEKSDNTAELILRSKIGDEKLQELVDSWGMTQTSIIENKTSLADVATILTKMKNGEITNSSSTIEMMDFMDKSEYEDRLPALLPKDVRVFHKIGNEVGNIHDVGIIQMPDGTSYFLGILSSDIGDTETQAKETIAQISKIVYDYTQKH
jgi:beta-lactamase class A